MTETTYIHDEPDGTSPHMIENQMSLEPGQDWLEVVWKRKAGHLPRVFVIAGTRITETDGMKALSIDEVQKILSQTHPEVRNATFNEEIVGGERQIKFMPRAGRKG